MHLKTLARLAQILVLAVALLPGVLGAQSNGAACFSDAAIDPIASRLLPLTTQTDELIAIEIQDGASAQSVYLLTRQMVLTERILRRMLGRGSACTAIADGIGREYAMLKRVFDALAKGDADLAIEPVASRRSQALLQQIRDTLAETDSAVLTLLRR